MNDKLINEIIQLLDERINTNKKGMDMLCDSRIEGYKECAGALQELKYIKGILIKLIVNPE